MIRHKPHCRVFDVAGVNDDTNCSCGATRRAQRKSGAPTMSRALEVLQTVIRGELKVLRMCSVEGATSLSLDEKAIKEACHRMEESLFEFQKDLFDRPELPLAGR